MKVTPHTQTTPLGQQKTVQSCSFTEKVSRFAQSVFAKIKSWACTCGRALKYALTAAGGKIGFVFFQALSWIHPSIGPRLESLALRVSCAWEALKGEWAKEESQNAMRALQFENQTLKNRLTDLEQTSERLKNAAESAEKQKSFAKELNSPLQQQIAALRELKETLTSRNERLSQQNQELTEKLQLKQAPKIEPRKQKTLSSEMAAQVEQVLKALKREAPVAGELDSQLSHLLPIMQKQLVQAESQLGILLSDVEKESSLECTLTALLSTLQELSASVKAAPQLMQMHSNWKNPLSALVEA